MISSKILAGKFYLMLTFDGVFFTLNFDRGVGLILSNLFLHAKTIEKVFFLILFCKVKYSQFS